MNVLKELAVELTGETPPKQGWIPPDTLLQRLTYSQLTIARNCGPQTTAEIVQWAQTRGTTIRPSFRVGRSLSAMWQDAVTKFTAGDMSRSEVAEVLEYSARRRNTRVPVAFQRMLLQLVKSSGR